MNKQLMQVAHINTRLYGGAAIAARRLHDSLIESDIGSRFYHFEDKSPNDSYIKLHDYNDNLDNLIIKYFQKIKKKIYNFKLERYLQERPKGYEIFAFPKYYFKTKLSTLDVLPNILHLHWISYFIDYPSFFASIPDSLPIVWTLHDMNPLTGGCHYSSNCERYKTKCFSCPQINNSSNSDLSLQGFLIKQQALKNKKIHIVANSYWLEREARTSTILSKAKSFQTIHYGLDPLVFTPKDKQICKQDLDIDPNCTVITFGAEVSTNKRKGIDLLISALSKIRKYQNLNNLLILTFGKGKIRLDSEDLKIRQLGFVGSPDRLSIIYSASDMFIIPSREEAFGQTALEAMACGTSVIGFDTGGIPDMVNSGKTGLLAKPENSSDLANKIQWMIDHPDKRKQMGINARELVEKEYSLEIQARKYIELYEKITKN